MTITEAENKFIRKIDCKFPYHNKEQCLTLIDEAAHLSSNAVFAVMEEICRIPYSQRETVSNEILLELLNQAIHTFEHPLKQMIAETAGKMIMDKFLTVDEAISKMRIVENFPGQYAALNILYASCDDVEQQLEPMWNSILDKWHDKK